MRDMNEIEETESNQLQLGFAGRPCRGMPRQRRAQRARWWFSQMRRVVDRAVAWPRTPPAPPEQACLTLAARRSQY
jgi:hypothetical protein